MQLSHAVSFVLTMGCITTRGNAKGPVKNNIRGGPGRGHIQDIKELLGDFKPRFAKVNEDAEFIENKTDSRSSVLTHVMKMASQIEAGECDKTYELSNGESALLFSRSDRYRYSCEQVFRSSSPNTNVSINCFHFFLKFNCFFESLTITVNDDPNQTFTYCRSTKVLRHTGSSLKVKYDRAVAGFNGGYVCVVVAESETRSAKQMVCPSCGISKEMEDTMTKKKEDDSTPPTENTQNRIVGGINARTMEFPWMVLLKIKVGSIFYRCGGNLVSDRLIVTAAHCLHGFSVAYIDVGLGKLNSDILSETGSVWRKTTRFTTHPDYDSIEITNDIAVVHLDEPITFGDTIKPICLPQEDNDLAAVTVTATGWGALSWSGSEAAILQKVSLSVWRNSDCEGAWRDFYTEASVRMLDSQICALGDGKDTCSGDSGGPLLAKIGNRYELVGITSYGYECATPGLPGVYTRVSKFTNWIKTYIDENACYTQK